MKLQIYLKVGTKIFFLSLGTPRDYFNEIKKRSANFPTFKGDFFVYSDIFSEGRPAYWSGYFTTRPFYKLLSSELEHNLRAAEILFTIAYNTARQQNNENAIKVFEKNYEKIIHARRNLGLFQHHDAITGTSKAAVMRDYAMRLFESTQNMVKMQESAIELLIQKGYGRHGFLLSELERDNFNKLPRKTPISLAVNGLSTDFVADAPIVGDAQDANKFADFVVYNSLAQKRLEVLTLRTQNPNVKIFNQFGEEIKELQVNPVWNITDNYEMPAGNTGSNNRIRISNRQFEVMFLAELEPLSLNTFKVMIDEVNYKRTLATVYCDDCAESIGTSEPGKPGPNEGSKIFSVKVKPPGMYD